MKQLDKPTSSANEQILNNLFADFNLSATQLKVAVLLLEGLSNQEVADRLGLALNSVKFHITYVFKKTKTRSRPEFITTFLTQYLRIQILEDVLHTLEAAETRIKAVRDRETRLISEYEGRLIMAKCRSHLKNELVAAWNTALTDLPVSTREQGLKTFLTALHLG